MKKTVFTLLTALLAFTCAFAQDKITLLHSEDDGFKWNVAFNKDDNNTRWAEDLQGRAIVPAVKDHSVIYMNGTFKLMDKDCKAVAAYTSAGKPIIAPGRYDEIVYVEYGGYYSVRKNGKYGACDVDGNELVAPVYSSIVVTDADGNFCTDDGKGGNISLNVSNPKNTGTKSAASSAPRKKTVSKPSFSEIIDMYDQAVAHPQSDAEGKLRLFLKVTEADPDNSHGYGALAYNNIGCIYGDAGNISKAIESFEKAIALRPDYTQAQNNLKIMRQRQSLANQQANRRQATPVAAATPGNVSTQGITSAGNGNSSSSRYMSESYYRDMYARWTRVAQSAYSSLTAAGVKVRNKRTGKDKEGSAAGTWSPGHYTGMKQEMRKAQREMRKTRQEALRAGYNIQKSEYEDINVSF